MRSEFFTAYNSLRLHAYRSRERDRGEEIRWVKQMDWYRDDGRAGEGMMGERGKR